MRAVVVLIAIVFSLSGSGCSFATVHGPPKNHRELPVVDCTSSRARPILDLVWTMAQSANLALLISHTDQQWGDAFGGNAPVSRKVAIPVYAALTALGAAGTTYGFVRSGACRKALRELRERDRNEPGLGTWPPPATTAAATADAAATPHAPPPTPVGFVPQPPAGLR